MGRLSFPFVPSLFILLRPKNWQKHHRFIYTKITQVQDGGLLQIVIQGS